MSTPEQPPSKTVLDWLDGKAQYEREEIRPELRENGYSEALMALTSQQAEILRLRQDAERLQQELAAARARAHQILGGSSPEPPAVLSKFDLAFEVMRLMDCEELDTLQSCHFGYVLRVEREKHTPPPVVGEVAILRNCLGNLYVAVENLGRVPSVPRDADVQFAMREAAQVLGPLYSTATKGAGQL